MRFVEDFWDGVLPCDVVVEAWVGGSHCSDLGAGWGVHDGVERLDVGAGVEVQVGHSSGVGLCL